MNTSDQKVVTIVGPNGTREVTVDGNRGEVIDLGEGECVISQDPVDGIPFWLRAAITQGQFMRLRSIALNLANIVYQDHKDQHIRAEIAELRKILGGKGGEKDKG